MIYVGENLPSKVTQKHFVQVWGNSGKNPSHPQKFAFSYTYATQLGKVFLSTVLSFILQ